MDEQQEFTSDQKVHRIRLRHSTEAHELAWSAVDGLQSERPNVGWLDRNASNACRDGAEAAKLGGRSNSFIDP